LPRDTAWDAELVESLLPAANVTLRDALAYAAWAEKHIPTPDEWRRSALSGCSNEEWSYPWGEEFLVGRCNTRESKTGQPWPVILSEAYDGCNLAGMCDIVGNVAEWAQTKEGQSFLCGGSFKDPAEKCSVQSRTLIDNPHFANSGVGFRCAATWSERMEKQADTSKSDRKD
jgi:formylglycine-generating enzyme required for sulfatase activity